jgi:hypothetical protein
MAFVRESRACAAALLVLGAACGGRDEGADPAPPPALVATPSAAHETANHPPVVSAVHFEPPVPMSGKPLHAVVDAADPDGDKLTFAFEWSVGGEPRAETGSEIALAQVAAGDRIEVTVRASDGRAKSDPVHAALDVRNLPPLVDSVRIEPGSSVSRGDPVRVTAQAHDPDGQNVELRYEWTVNDREVAGDGARLSTEGLHKDDAIRVWVVASDGEDESDAVPSAVVSVANSEPEIVSTPSGVSSDGSFRYQMQARDPDGDRNLRFRLKSGPPGMAANPVTGEVTWHAGPGQDGKFPVELVVEDSDGAQSVQSFELTVKTEAAAKAEPTPTGRRRRPAPAPAAPAPEPEE